MLFGVYLIPFFLVYGCLYYLYRESRKEKASKRETYKILDIQTQFIREDTSDFGSVFSEAPIISFQTLLDCIHRARDDEKVLGISLSLNEGSTIGLAKTQELFEELRKFKKSNKIIMAYGRNINMRDYILGLTAEHLYMQPSGILNIIGLCLPSLFFKRLLDWAGIEPYVLKREAYKSAMDPFIEDQMTQEYRESLTSLGLDLHGQYLSVLEKQLSEKYE